jgi:hypothetical protein
MHSSCNNLGLIDALGLMSSFGGSWDLIAIGLRYSESGGCFSGRGGGGPFNQPYGGRRPDQYRQHDRRDNYPPPMKRDR